MVLGVETLPLFVCDQVDASLDHHAIPFKCDLFSCRVTLIPLERKSRQRQAKRDKIVAIPGPACEILKGISASAG
jgi:hypothetical protein